MLAFLSFLLSFRLTVTQMVVLTGTSETSSVCPFLNLLIKLTAEVELAFFLLLFFILN